MATCIAVLRPMAKKFLLHAMGILIGWEHQFNCGKMEGVNTKINTLTRQAYGYRDVAFLLLKLPSPTRPEFILFG